MSVARSSSVDTGVRDQHNALALGRAVGARARVFLQSACVAAVPADLWGMYRSFWAERLNGRQRGVYAVAMTFGLIIASAMFFELDAPTGNGGEYDCGPTAYALLAGPVVETAAQADCQTAALQRTTTVSGLLLLSAMGAAMGARLVATPRPPARAPQPTVRTQPLSAAPRRRPQASGYNGHASSLPGHPHAD